MQPKVWLQPLPRPPSPARASESSSRTPSPRHRSSPCLSKSPATCSGESTLSFAPLSFLLSDSTRARLPWTLSLSFSLVFFYHPLLRPAVYRTTIHVRHTARRNLLQLLKSLCNTPAVPALFLSPFPFPSSFCRVEICSLSTDVYFTHWYDKIWKAWPNVFNSSKNKSLSMQNCELNTVSSQYLVPSYNMGLLIRSWRDGGDI